MGLPPNRSANLDLGTTKENVRKRRSQKFELEPVPPTLIPHNPGELKHLYLEIALRSVVGSLHVCLELTRAATIIA